MQQDLSVQIMAHSTYLSKHSTSNALAEQHRFKKNSISATSFVNMNNQVTKPWGQSLNVEYQMLLLCILIICSKLRRQNIFSVSFVSLSVLMVKQIFCLLLIPPLPIIFILISVAYPSLPHKPKLSICAILSSPLALQISRQFL